MNEKEEKIEAMEVENENKQELEGMRCLQVIDQNAMQVTNAEQYELMNRFRGKWKRINRQKWKGIVQERVDNKEKKVRVGIKRGMVVKEEKVEDSEIQSKRVRQKVID